MTNERYVEGSHEAATFIYNIFLFDLGNSDNNHNCNSPNIHNVDQTTTTTNIKRTATTSDETKKENPVKFIETFLFQYLNPKGVTVAIIVVSTYVELGENYINYATQVVLLALLFSSTSITLWTFIGKFLRKFATNDKFIKYFNYAMSSLLLLSIITFYI